MKIAYLSLLSPSGQPAVSGVPKVSETLLRQFESMPEVDVDAITLVDGLERESTVERGRVRYHHLPCKPRGKTATFYWREIRLLKERVRETGAELVHGQPTGEYLSAAVGCGLPHVVTIHGLVMRETAGLSMFEEGFLAGAVREAIQRRAVRKARNIISISPYVDTYLKGRTGARIWPVCNPIDEEFFHVASPEREGLRILCVGIVSERKNQAALIQACSLLKKRGMAVQCHLVGKIDPAYVVKVRQMIIQAGLDNDVTLTGVVSREALKSEYEWSNVVALPSREETSPLSLIQAMAAGRCVFGADSAGIPALLDRGRYGTLFSGEDPGALAETLGRWVADPGLFWDKAAAGRAHAHSAFRPAAVAEKTVEVYRQIITQAKAGYGLP